MRKLKTLNCRKSNSSRFKTLVMRSQMGAIYQEFPNCGHYLLVLNDEFKTSDCLAIKADRLEEIYSFIEENPRIAQERMKSNFWADMYEQSKSED